MKSAPIIGLSAAFALLFAGAVALADNNPDQTFITTAIQINLAEIQVGQLAEEKASSDAAKAYGKQLVDDHTASNQKATALATAAGVTPPTEPSDADKALYQKLSGLSGAAFDRQFARAMVTGHRQALKLFMTEAKSGTGDIASFAKDTLPTLRDHLKMAREILKPPKTSS